ncbi:MAG: hypothetical protein MSS87_08570 [Bacteroidales bacterium]|nr:hypothetical protein [Bacteroidales bacterium]MDY5737571.1 hypothetical protein [Candidatus Onthomorpha sp.]
MEEAQRVLDDATGESYLPAENLSNLALLLAAMYKGEKQTLIQGTINFMTLFKVRKRQTYLKHLTILHELFHKLLKKY